MMSPKGSITLDGVDIREVKQSDLRDKIGYVPQKGNLFSGTIESNLLYADKNATEEVLKEAVEIAQASEFIFDNPRRDCNLRFPRVEPMYPEVRSSAWRSPGRW